jgi:hypothetical protein
MHLFAQARGKKVLDGGAYAMPEQMKWDDESVFFILIVAAVYCCTLCFQSTAFHSHQHSK